ncbi:MAG: AAA family ATPase [Planctomycetia bacterium]|nr:AAA family ATPase [Planctomycetia bacterium]
MFPLNVILVGVSEELAPRLRRDLCNLLVTIEAEFPDATSAVTALRASRQTIRLLIVEPAAETGPAALRQLSGGLLDWPILALVDARQDPSAAIRANRNGADQVVPLPVDAHDLGEALNCIGAEFGSLARACRVVAVTGTQGGCGSTTVALTLAYQFATAHDRHAILVEMAEQMGVVASNLNIEPKFTLADLINDIEHVDAQVAQRALNSVCHKFEVLASCGGIVQYKSALVPAALRIVECTRRLSEVLVLDVPCTFSDLQFELLGVADEVVLVCEQSISSLRTLKLMIDALQPARPLESIHPVLNRYDAGIAGLGEHKLRKALGLQKVLAIPDDRASAMAAINQGRPIQLAARRSPMVEAIDGLAASVLHVESEPRPPESRSGLLKQLLHAFTR